LEPHRAPHRPISGKSASNDPDYEKKTNENKRRIAAGEKVVPFSRDTSLTDLGRNAASMLDAMIDLLILSNQRQRVKRCWIIRTVEEGLEKYTGYPVDQQSWIQTQDFTTMYTMIPHADMKAALRSAIDDAVGELAYRHAMTPAEAETTVRFTGAGTWAISHDKGDWNSAQLKEVCDFIIDNTFFMNGGQIFRQKVGIAMGENASPPQANLFLYTKERDFVNKLVAQHGEETILEKAHGFQYNARFIDYHNLAKNGRAFPDFARRLRAGAGHDRERTRSQISWRPAPLRP
jgi:hypothetical protein